MEGSLTAPEPNL